MTQILLLLFLRSRYFPFLFQRTLRSFLTDCSRSFQMSTSLFIWADFHISRFPGPWNTTLQTLSTATCERMLHSAASNSNAPVHWSPEPGKAAPVSSGAPPAATGCWPAGSGSAALAGPWWSGTCWTVLRTEKKKKKKIGKDQSL